MDRNAWRQHCEMVDRLLKQIQAQGAPGFTPEEETHFQTSLDANEFGMAFDLLCWKIEHSGRPISKELYHLISEVGSKMEAPPEDWETLEALVR
jgi:hypothetical protein